MIILSGLYPTLERPEMGAFVARRAQALRRRGVDVRVVAPTEYESGTIPRHIRLLVRALRVPGPIDAVEGHVVYPTGAIAVLVARLRRCPSILYAHGADVRHNARHGRLHNTLARITVRMADRLVTNSQATARLVAELGRRAVVIPPGVDQAEFSPGDRAIARRRLGLPTDALIALYVGALIPRKGADVFAAALDAAPDWLGVMVGGGELADSIAAHHPSVRMIGTVSPTEVPDWMRAADVVVVPSRVEPLGVAAVEALASGDPVIASAVDGLLETVADGLNGILVPPDDPSVVAGALRRLGDPELRARLAGAARASVADHDLDRVAERMAQLWASLGVRA